MILFIFCIFFVCFTSTANPDKNVKKRKLDPESAFFASVLDDTSDGEEPSSSESAKDEVLRYVKSRGSKQPILQYWGLSKQSFPRVSRVAKRILNIPASSTPSERSFSTAGRTLEDRRSALDPDKADMLLFLHSNY